MVLLFQRLTSMENSYTISYKRWAITQRINELKKSLKRISKDSLYYKQRQEELENLQKDLDD